MSIFEKKDKSPSKTVMEDVCKVKKDEKVLIIADNKLTLSLIIGYMKTTQQNMVAVSYDDGKCKTARHENEILRLEGE